MTLKEAANLVAWAAANFPALQDKDLRPTAELWHRMMPDVPYEIAEKALMKVLSTAKYFPTVAELREAVAELTNPDVPSAMEAWAEVVKAVKIYGHYRPEEALNSLPALAKKVAKSIGWYEICLSEQPDVVRGQFRMAYEQELKRLRERASLPPDVKALLDRKPAGLLEGR